MEMSQSSGSGLDWNLSDEILSVIPTDPYDQLDLARKITSMAIASRVSNLQSENGKLKQKVHEKDRQTLELQDKVSQFEQAFQEVDLRLKITREDNMKLSKERDSLVMTAKKLGRDLAKLETFKRQLMQSLNDDNSSPTQTVDIMTCDQSVPRAYPLNETKTYPTQHSFSGSSESDIIADDASKQAVQKFSLTPYLSPRLTPTGTPKVFSTSVPHRSYSTTVSPQKASGTTTPAKLQYDGRGSLSSWYPSSQQSTAANSPSRGRPIPARAPRIDGKEFFRQARSRLSYEQFSAFLANIKELNAQKQSREETLEKADKIFGMDNKDLYLSFQGLINRKVN